MSSRNHNQIKFYDCFIQAGQVAYAKDPSLIYAVCGNGVLIVIQDRITRIGGVAHCIYPKKRWKEKPTNYHTETAIHSLVKSLTRINAIPQNCEAQLYGGANLRGQHKRRAEQVVRRAKKVLKKMNIKIISEDVGGQLGRKVIFNTISGEVIINKTRQIRRTDWSPEIQRKPIGV